MAIGVIFSFTDKSTLNIANSAIVKANSSTPFLTFNSSYGGLCIELEMLQI